MAVEVEARCRICGGIARLVPGAGEERVPCPGCGSGVAASWPADRLASGVEACVLCGYRRFYTQRDFNRRSGLWIVLAAVAASAWLYAKGPPLVWLAVLGAVTVADSLLVRILPRVTVCYVCTGVYRGVPARGGEEPFDPKVAASVEPLQQGLAGGAS